MIRFGIAGHRNIEDKSVVEFITSHYLAILEKAKTENVNVTAVSAIAEGADTIFAEVALSLNIPLEVVRPFAEYSIDFETKDNFKRYEKLRRRAVREIKLPYSRRSDAAYQAAMYWIVENCDVLVAAWNGKNGKPLGGTKDAVDRAILINKPWIHLNVADLSVDFNLSS